MAARQVAASAPATQAVPFVVKAGKTHVDVRATDKALGMRELLEVMRADPNLAKCAIESCAFDGQFFTARLRIEQR